MRSAFAIFGIAFALLVATGARADPRLDAQLCVAAEGPHADQISALLKQGANLGAVCEAGESPLHVAARTAWLPNLYALVSAGANVNLLSAHGYTPLAAVHSAHAAEFLLAKGADVSRRNPDGETPLIQICDAAYSWNFSGVEASNIASVLLAAGADVNAQANDGQTALIKAVLKPGVQPLVATLLNHGANPNLHAGGRWGALGMAEQREKNERLGNGKDVQDFLDYEALIRAHGGRD
ncbi:MAG TPA: ankyrin repeat domain-containing protein [Caulobacteraceae bacterium]|jgi:ankyrin repeat protein|nr:ankyrin repeat domain-containing protein [Caulobacteraceae bacterium]